MENVRSEKRRDVDTMVMNEQDERNQRTWKKSASMHWLTRRPGFVPGEEVAFEYVREQMKGEPILELGVGTGRTIPFTAPLTSDYRALDYLPNMVAACHETYPDKVVELGDARTLAGYPDAHFGMVTFAFNGIDAVSHGDRALVFRAVRRVLAPGGLFFFSTLNLDGPEPRERPWQVKIERSRNPIVLGVRALRAGRYVAINVANWARLQRMVERGPGYAVAPLAAHEFGILAHYTTLKCQLDELVEHGFEGDPAVFSSSGGARVNLGDDTSGASYFHLVARARGRE